MKIVALVTVLLFTTGSALNAQSKEPVKPFRLSEKAEIQQAEKLRTTLQKNELNAAVEAPAYEAKHKSKKHASGTCKKREKKISIKEEAKL